MFFVKIEMFLIFLISIQSIKSYTDWHVVICIFLSFVISVALYTMLVSERFFFILTAIFTAFWMYKAWDSVYGFTQDWIWGVFASLVACLVSVGAHVEAKAKEDLEA